MDDAIARSRSDAHWLGLSDRTAVITGAAGGVGAALAKAFHDAGCRVALLDRDVAACTALAETLSPAGADQPLVLACDVSDEASVRAAAAAVQARIGPAAILVNNAAILKAGAILDLPLADWNALLSINLTGYLLCAQAFGAQMKEAGGGAMIHIGSVAGKFPQPASGGYSVAKAGVDMLSRLLAVELGPWAIRSNVISPCMIETPMSAAFYADPDLRARREAMVPLRRIGMPDDIARAALWLASPQADYVTGTDLPVDGAMPGNLLGLIPRPGYGN